MKLAFAPLLIALVASAPVPPMHRLNCELRTVYDGRTKRSTRIVVLAPNSWREAEWRQPLIELCASKSKDGYRCSLKQKVFEASAGSDGDERSVVRIDLQTGRYVDRGYMDGKPIQTTGICRRTQRRLSTHCGHEAFC
jgi:hypothetical protein